MEVLNCAKEFGAKNKKFAERKGMTLNAYAKQLGATAGYLSNQETEKTETIPLSLLETLQKEFAIFPVVSSEKEDVHLTDRFSSIQQQYLVSTLKSRSGRISSFIF
ncbi:MAG: helix-turn-helix domain-containing protein [Bacillota bacterium]|uniref:transcriptional regulator n=1 Tax=Bacillales TaxID=1385 RepID=UPI0025704A0B|nr:transcriptional regulator [Paenibacillus sp. FSL R5-0490]